MNWLDEGIAKVRARQREEEQQMEVPKRIESYLLSLIDKLSYGSIRSTSIFRRVPTPDSIRTYLDDFLAQAGASPAVWDTTGFVGRVGDVQIVVADVGHMVPRRGGRGDSLNETGRAAVLHALRRAGFVEARFARGFSFGDSDSTGMYSVLVSQDGGWWIDEPSMKYHMKGYPIAVERYLVDRPFKDWAIHKLA